MDQYGASEHRVAPERMEDAIRAAVAHSAEADGYVIGHFELIAELHKVGDVDAPAAITNTDPVDQAPRRVRWSPPGSSPHLSLGLLTAACARLKNQLGRA